MSRPREPAYGGFSVRETELPVLDASEEGLPFATSESQDRTLRVLRVPNQDLVAEGRRLDAGAFATALATFPGER